MVSEWYKTTFEFVNKATSLRATNLAEHKSYLGVALYRILDKIVKESERVDKIESRLRDLEIAAVRVGTDRLRHGDDVDRPVHREEPARVKHFCPKEIRQVYPPKRWGYCPYCGESIR